MSAFSMFNVHGTFQTVTGQNQFKKRLIIFSFIFHSRNDGRSNRWNHHCRFADSSVDIHADFRAIDRKMVFCRYVYVILLQVLSLVPLLIVSPHRAQSFTGRHVGN